MGKNVYGRDPKNRTGEYFSASLWVWRPIQALMDKLCSDLLMSDAVLREGAGVTDEEACIEMAERFAEWIEGHGEGHTIDPCGPRVTEEGRFVSSEERASNPELKTYAAYHANTEELKKWTEFLRNCGGFEIW